MPQAFIRIISILVLVSLFCFSGVSRACLLLADPVTAADSCCPAEQQHSDESRDSGTTPECPCCAACSGAIIVTTISVPVLVARDASHPHYCAQTPPAGFRPSIDRPPEAA